MTQAPVKLLTSDQWIVDRTFQLIHSKISERYPVHWHEFYEIHFFVSGEGTHVLNGESYPIVPGTLFFVTPTDLHELIPKVGHVFELYNFIFCEEFLSQDFYDMVFTHSRELHTCCMGESYDNIEREFIRIQSETREIRAGSTRIIQGAVERILIDLMRSTASSDEVGKFGSLQVSQHRAIQKALVYINHHFREKLTLPDVARQAQLSANYFSECFREVTGTQFQSYIQGLRLRFARSLVRATDLPITDICFASGFNTLAHFERAFRQKFGMSPRSMRDSDTQSLSWSEPDESV